MLKIDGSFVRDILKDPRAESMVQAIAQLARSMNLVTVAEYVESDEIRLRVATLGVDYGQGFAIARPVSMTEIVEELPVYAIARGLWARAGRVAARQREHRGDGNDGRRRVRRRPGEDTIVMEDTQTMTPRRAPGSGSGRRHAATAGKTARRFLHRAYRQSTATVRQHVDFPLYAPERAWSCCTSSSISSCTWTGTWSSCWCVSTCGSTPSCSS